VHRGPGSGSLRRSLRVAVTLRSPAVPAYTHDAVLAWGIGARLGDRLQEGPTHADDRPTTIVVVDTRASGPTQQYIVHGRASIPGWFVQQDAELFALLSALQHEEGVVGDLLEIGVYQGRSAVLLGYLTGPDERVILCDLFGSSPDATPDIRHDLQGYDGLDLETFAAHWHRFHAGEPGEIVVGRSSRLEGRSWDRPVRFIHIDGGHTYDVVRDDISIARDALADAGGVVVFDDVRASHAPGVGAAVWAAVESGGLVPFAQSWKLYASWDAQFAARAADAVFRAMPCTDHVVRDHRLVEVHERRRSRSTSTHRWTPPALVPAASKLRRSLRAAARRPKR